jgi:outer membrane protein
MKKIILVTLILFLASANLFSQKIGFINTQLIREKLPDAKLADQRAQTIVEEWKRELKSMEEKEDALLFDMQKNRLIWSDLEKTQKEKEIDDLRKNRTQYANEKFSPNGEFDKVTAEIITPVEEKIFAAVQEVASKEKYDFIWDQSTQPLPYVNFKYDITLKVLKLLGVDVSLEEKEQEEKIAQDPRNDEVRKRQESQAPRRRSRTATKPDSTATPPAVDMQQQQLMQPKEDMKK